MQDSVKGILNDDIYREMSNEDLLDIQQTFIDPLGQSMLDLAEMISTDEDFKSFPAYADLRENANVIAGQVA